MSKFSKRINELLGSEGKPMNLSRVDAELAKAVAAPEAGTKDGKPEDDKYGVNTEAPVTVSTLSPAQKEVIPMKALSFALGYLDKKDPDLDDMEAIVSADWYIMDGHHRWAAATLVDPNKKVKVAKIEMPAVDLITALNIYTKGALTTAKGEPVTGNQGAGNLEEWLTLVKKEIETAFEKGFSEEAGNATLPGGKPNWPMFLPGKGKTAEEVKALFAKVPGAKGDAEKGKEIMLANSAKLKTTKLPTAPERIDMPVIDASKTVTGQDTSDVRQSQLYDVCKRIENGTLDLKEPYGKEVSAKLGGKPAQAQKPAQAPAQGQKPVQGAQIQKESRVIKTYEKFIQKYKK